MPPEARGVQPPEVDFGELYSSHFPRVYAYVYGRVQDKEAALDVVSDVFERGFLNISSLRSQDRLGSWLFTIARNVIFEHWRKEQRGAAKLLKVAGERKIQNSPPSPEELFLREERLGSLSRFVRQLPRREQEIIRLKFDAELSHREIAEVLNLSYVNVRVMLFRVLRKLHERMQDL